MQDIPHQKPSSCVPSSCVQGLRKDTPILHAQPQGILSSCWADLIKSFSCVTSLIALEFCAFAILPLCFLDSLARNLGTYALSELLWLCAQDSNRWDEPNKASHIVRITKI